MGARSVKKVGTPVAPASLLAYSAETRQRVMAGPLLGGTPPALLR